MLYSVCGYTDATTHGLQGHNHAHSICLWLHICDTQAWKTILKYAVSVFGYVDAKHRRRLTLSVTSIPGRHTEIEVPTLNSLRLFLPLRMSTWQEFYQNALYWQQVHQINCFPSCMSISTFQPGNFTGWGSEGVKKKDRDILDQNDQQITANGKYKPLKTAVVAKPVYERKTPLPFLTWQFVWQSESRSGECCACSFFFSLSREISEGV